MNMASWIILGIVAVIIGFAAWGTFGKVRRGGGCCGSDKNEARGGVQQKRIMSENAECASCQSCSGCSGCSNAHVLQPTIKPIK